MRGASLKFESCWEDLWKPIAYVHNVTRLKVVALRKEKASLHQLMLSRMHTCLIISELFGSEGARRGLFAGAMQRCNNNHMTSSSNGLYSSVGQAYYGSPKLGLAGFARTLQTDRLKYIIRVRTGANIAVAQTMRNILFAELIAVFKSKGIVPATRFLVSAAAPSAAVVGVIAGATQAAYITITAGVALGRARANARGDGATLGKDCRWHGQIVPASGDQQAPQIMQTLEAARASVTWKSYVCTFAFPS